MVPRLIRIFRIQWWCSFSPFRPEVPFFGKFGPKRNQICQFKLIFGTSTNSNMQNSVVVFILCFRLEISFLGKFGPKNKNYLLKLKLSTNSNSNMQNSMVIFIFIFCLRPEVPFLGKFGPKIKNCSFEVKFDA